MSGEGSKAFSVGLVAFVALAAIGVGVFLVGSEQRFWEGHADYRLHFTRTNGLQEGAPVALDGVNIGRVSRMRFPADPRAQYVEVDISVATDVVSRIRRDTTAKIGTLGMLGDKYIELSSGTLDSETVEFGGLIRSVDPIDYESIFGQSGDIVSNAIEVTALLKQTLTDINNGEGLVGRLIGDQDFGRQFADDLSLTIANIESATSRLDETFIRIENGEGALGVIMQNEDEMESIVSNINVASKGMADLTTRLNEGRGTIPRLIHDEEYAATTLGNLSDATTSINEIASQIRSGRGTVGKLVYDDQLYDDAATLVGGDSGGFWRLVGRGMLWFWPFSGVGTDTALADQ
jgi:phospholipid/cholesterol/gamma-HCH transport system substrate-binding protein